MPGSQREVAHAEEEGVVFVWLAAPEGFAGTVTVERVLAHRIHLGVGDASGRQTPQKVEGSQFGLPADLVILALGFDPEDVPTLFDEPDLKLDRWGAIAVEPKTLATSIDGVFAAGDIVRGASLVVWAVRDGRVAADSIARYLAARARQASSLAAD